MTKEQLRTVLYNIERGDWDTFLDSHQDDRDAVLLILKKFPDADVTKTAPISLPDLKKYAGDLYTDVYWLKDAKKLEEAKAAALELQEELVRISKRP